MRGCNLPADAWHAVLHGTGPARLWVGEDQGKPKPGDAVAKVLKYRTVKGFALLPGLKAGWAARHAQDKRADGPDMSAAEKVGACIRESG